MSHRNQSLRPPISKRLIGTSRTLSFLWGGSLAGAGLAFLSTIVVSRYLGVAEFGLFTVAQTIAALCGPLAGFGLAQLWLQVFGAGIQEGGRWASASSKYCLVTFSIVISIVFTWAILGPHEFEESVVFLLAIPIIAGQLVVELVSSALQVHGKYEALAIWQVVPHLLRFILIILVCALADTATSAVLIVGAYALVGVVITSFGGIRVGKFIHSTGSQRRGERFALLDVLEAAWPFGAGIFLNLLYYQSNILLLKYMDGNESAGYYGLAFSVMGAVYLLPTSIFQKYFLPKIHSWIIEDDQKLRQVYWLGSTGMALTGIVAGILVFFVAAPLVPVVFGGEYKPVSSVLRILALCVPLMFVSIGVGSLLATSKSMKLKLRLMGIVALVNVACNIFLITEYSYLGAAWATVISNVVLAALYVAFVNLKVLGPTSTIHHER